MHCPRHRAARTVFHIEGNPIVAQSVARRMSHWPEVRYAGFATSGREGIEWCREKAPDIVLLDLLLPDLDGFVVVDRLNELHRPPLIVLLSGRADDLTLYRVWSGKVPGFIWNLPHWPEHLRAAFAALAGGETYLPADLVKMMAVFRASPHAFFKLLPPRKIEILARLGRGEMPEQIAMDTECSAATVEWHLYEIMHKLGLHSRADLERWMAMTGFMTALLPAPPCEIAG